MSSLPKTMGCGWDSSDFIKFQAKVYTFSQLIITSCLRSALLKHVFKNCKIFAISVRCPELGGVRSQRFKFTVSIGKSIGGMSSVRCIEFVHFSEGPLLEVLL